MLPVLLQVPAAGSLEVRVAQGKRHGAVDLPRDQYLAIGQQGCRVTQAMP